MTRYQSCDSALSLSPLVSLNSLSSDGWATDDLVYKWKDVDPVQIVPGLHLPRFTLEQYKSAYCNVITNTGEWGADLSTDNYMQIGNM